MINEQDKQRIEKEAFELSEYASHYALYNSGIKDGYVAGATSELERSEKLLQEYREVIRECRDWLDNSLNDMEENGEPPVSGCVIQTRDLFTKCDKVLKI